jgi:RNA polymerase primary sigma factor
MGQDTPKDSPEILNLIKLSQEGNSRAENKLVEIYSPYVTFMVKKYSKKTDIKDDDDLRSCINIGLLEGIRRFDPKRNAKFIYFAHIWMKKSIFLEEASYRFIRVPVNQKIFYDSYAKEINELELKNSYEQNDSIKKFLELDNTKTELFTDLSSFDEDTGVSELPEHLLLDSCVHIDDEENFSINTLKTNIKKTLSAFNEKEIYIIEHLFGLNGVEIMSSEQIAKDLSVTKVNITFTKTRIIRMLRHISLSNKILKDV